MLTRFFFTTVWIAGAVLLLGCGGGDVETPTETTAPADEPATKMLDLSQAGSVAGKVSFTGQASRRARLRMEADPNCAAAHSSPVYFQQVEVSEGGSLNNVFVWIKEGLEGYQFDPPEEPVTLNQKGCIYRPHVFGVQTRQDIQILNNDPTTHNIHPLPANNREWNQSQPAQGAPLMRSFPRQEVMIAVKCNIHPWMRSYIGVVSHPYFAVTGAEGEFQLKDLPPGEYTVEAWHEKLGTTEQKVTIGPSEAKQVDFTFQG